MAPTPPWKRICFVLAGLLLLQSLSLFRHVRTDPSDLTTTCSNLSHRIRDFTNRFDHTTNLLSAQAVKEGKLLPWNELPTSLDGEIIDNLSSEQCDHAFPDLYHEIDRATAYWRKRDHTITSKDVSIAWKDYNGDKEKKDRGGAMRLLIHDNHLRIIEGMGIFNTGWRLRATDVLFLLHRALESATAASEILPTIEIAITVSDILWLPDGPDGTQTAWTWTRRLDNATMERHWLMPNFDMWHGARNFSYRDSWLAAKNEDAPFRSKIPKLVWRGHAWLNMDIRQKLLDAGKGKHWSDMEKLDGGHEDDNFLDNDVLCKYAMTVHTEGASYSGRLKWLTSCNSLMFFHEPTWTMYYYHLLEASGPNQNYIAVKNDWSDLEEKVQFYLDHPEKAETIIQNFLDTFRNRYLQRAAVSCYTRKLIKAWSEVAFKPEIQRPASDKLRTLRGVPFEKAMLDLKDFGNADS